MFECQVRKYFASGCASVHISYIKDIDLKLFEDSLGIILKIQLWDEGMVIFGSKWIHVETIVLTLISLGINKLGQSHLPCVTVVCINLTHKALSTVTVIQGTSQVVFIFLVHCLTSFNKLKTKIKWISL